MHDTNHQYRLAARPQGLPKKTDWEFTQESIRPLSDGEVLIKILYVSLDPAMRGWMNEGKSYVPPIKIGEVMRALAVGKIVASKNNQFAKGDYVSGLFGLQEYIITDGKELMKVDPSLAPLPVFLSALGMPGMTAYFGLLDVTHPKAGETVVVSGAAGAVGSLVGQIAKIKGCRVIGIAGGKQKTDYLINELGFDAAIDYKNENVREALKKYCPQGIDIYFDNVGGDTLDAALSLLALHGRIAICGAISQYNNADGIEGPTNYLSLLINRGKMQGFIVFDYLARYPEAINAMLQWMKEGKLKTREDIVKGIDQFYESFLMLFKGENKGKLILQVGEE